MKMTKEFKKLKVYKKNKSPAMVGCEELNRLVKNDIRRNKTKAQDLA